LSRTLKAAQLVRIPGGLDAALETLKAGKADAYAENAHMLTRFAAQLPGWVVLEGRYTVVQHGIAMPRGRPAALAYIKDFVEQAKAAGVIRQAIKRAGLHRTHVPPLIQ
jgi:polar amino acid transport system substrate-binding protein